MKKTLFISLALILIITLSLSACTGRGDVNPDIKDSDDKTVEAPLYDPSTFTVTLDENGIATWTKVEGAVKYQYCFVDHNNDTTGTLYTTNTKVQVPSGYAIQVCPVFENGDFGNIIATDYFSIEEPPTPAEPTVPYDPTAFTVTLDDNGLATWPALEGAVVYEYYFADLNAVMDAFHNTTDTQVQVPSGYSVQVCPVFENGEIGEWAFTDIYYDGTTPDPDNGDNKTDDEPDPDNGGNKTDDEPNPDVYKTRVHYNFNVYLEDLESYEIISNINYDSVKSLADGKVYFEATGPDGKIMRFEGKGITITQGTITFEPKARLTALDAIGRICTVNPVVTQPGSSENWIEFSGGYTFTSATKVDSADDLFFIWGFTNPAESFTQEDLYGIPHVEFQPNFFSIAAYKDNTDAFTVSKLIIYYDSTTYNTGIRMLALDPSMYGTYMEGQYYDVSRERYDSAKNIYDFYLFAIPDTKDEIVPFNPDPLIDEIAPRSLMDFDMSRYTIGDLKDPNGKVLDKNNAKLSIGSTLEVTLGDYTLDVLLPVLEWYKGAENLHELAPYNNALPTGEVTALVVPVVWQDQPENATDEILNTLLKEAGRVVDEKGNVTDYSDTSDKLYSLSEYYDLASYGQHKITSFVTEWYKAPFNFKNDMENMSIGQENFITDLYSWLMKTYPSMDWSRFDRDEDGFFDAVIVVNTGKTTDGVMLMASHGYAAHFSPRYTGDNAGTKDRPNIKNHIIMNMFFLDGVTMIHEYAHSFGLVDYYDVTYSGIDAVGSYDMQSGSAGDWNPYSKYAVGWIEPTVVQGLEKGQHTDVTIGGFAQTGDAIVIPAAGTAFDGPFGEYILIDLFTDGGVNEYDAERFGLDGAVGVRIYHVSSPMEKRVLTGEDGKKYPIGTIHYANAYNEEGKYLVELIQAGGDNTFTDTKNLRTALAEKDLFKAGDLFDANSYAEFLTNGRMDDGSEFGYTVEIISIDKDSSGQYNAVIRITRK